MIDHAMEQLKGRVDDAYTDCQALLCHALNVGRGWLIGHADDEVDGPEVEKFETLVQQRARGEPVAYLTGHREFWSLDLMVTPDTLIPRPETEDLVEQVLQLNLPDKHIRLLDFGTGSGAIAIAIARERPGWDINALEISDAALAIARFNAGKHHTESIHFMQGSRLADTGTEKFDVIVSNPPYIAEADPHLTRGDVRFEPRHALVSGKDGLDCIRELVADARKHLTDAGYLITEHGWDQADAIHKLFKDHNYSTIRTIRDLAGHERVTMAILKAQ